MYESDLDADHFDRSSCQHLLHQDVLDILPNGVNLDPRASEGELDVLKLRTAGNLLSLLWSYSALPTKISFNLARARPVSANTSSNQLAEQCSMFCFLLATRKIEGYGKFGSYIIITLCHQVSAYSREAKATMQSSFLIRSRSGLQLVWKSSADKDIKARTCAGLLSSMTYISWNLCSKVKPSSLWLLMLTLITA